MNNLKAMLVLELKDQLTEGLNKITKLFDQLGSLGKKLSLGKLENGSDGLRKTGMEAETLVGHLRGVSNAADRAWSALRRMGEAPVRKIGQALGAQGAIGALGAAAQGYSLYAPVEKYADFENIARHSAITEGLSGAAANAESRRLMAMFQRDALASSQNSTAIAQAYQDLIQTGIKPEQAEKLLPIHSRAATAYNISPEALGHAVFALSDSFKIDEGGMGGALAAMAMASKEGRFKVEDFSHFLPSIGGNMAKLGMTGRGSADTAFAALETVMKNSADPSAGATNFTDFMNYLTSPMAAHSFSLSSRGMAAPTKAMLSKYGITGIDMPQLLANARNQGMDPITAVLGTLQKKLAGLPPDVMAEVLGAFFHNQQARDAALSLLMHSKDFLDMRAHLGAADAGLLDRDFATAVDAPRKKLDLLHETMGQLEVRVGQGFLPVMLRLNQAADALSNSLRLLDERFPGASDGILAVAGGVLAFGAVMGAIGFVTPSVTAGFNLLKAGFEFLLSPMQSVKWLLVDIALPLGLFVAALEGIKHLLPEGDKALEKAARPGGPLDGGPYGHTYDGYDVMGRPISSLPQLKSPGDSWSPGGDGGLEPRSAATPPVVTVMVGVDPDTGQLKINRAESNSRQVDIWSGYLNQGLAVGVP